MNTAPENRILGVFLALGVFVVVVPLLCVPVAIADPVWGEIFTLEQPDGTGVNVRIWGDEFYRVVESLTGYTLVRDPVTSEICYARLSTDGENLVSTGIRVDRAQGATLGLDRHIRIDQDKKRAVIEEARRNKSEYESDLLATAGLPLRVDPPCNGNVKGICLIVDFFDEVATIPAGDIDDYCNMVGYTGYSNNGSVRDYFYDVSDGNLTYTNFVPSGYYRAQYSKAYYDDCNAPYGQRARELIIEALNDLNDSGFDFSQYDSNGDGLIDAINCFYAGLTSCGWANGLWPHSGGISFQADGVSAYRYQITGLGSSLRLSTFCHENGHMICFWPDLYDYDHDSSGVGRFCIMCSYTSSTDPQEPCAYLKYIAGWATTNLLTVPQVGLTAPSTSNTLYKYEHPSLGNEYYLIENRQRVGRDSGLPDAGVAIWHIDTDGSNSDQDMTPESHYEATLVQADGNWDLENYINTGDGTDLWSAPGYVECTSSTDPNTYWWDGSQSLLAITKISANATIMTFDFSLSPEADFAADVVAGCPPLTVNFTDLSPGPVVAWSWRFGDGDSSAAQNPSHQYTTSDTFTVSLTVTTAEGSGTETKADYITIPSGAVCEIEPGQLGFGSVEMFDSRDLSFTIANLGCDTLSGVISEFCAPFSIVSGGGAYNLAEFQSLEVTVRFSPTTTGTFNCWIETGSGMCADLLCTGTGIQPPPTCSIEPDTLDFGALEVGNFAILSFDITNVGYGLLSGTVSEAHNYFAITSAPDYLLTHGQTHTVNVLFMAGAAGTFNCTVETGSGLCTDVFCTGIGGSPPVCFIEPDSLDFGLVAVSDSLDKTFFITNTGGGVLSGSVSDTCGCYEVITGEGPYDLAAGDTVYVVVRFGPPAAGPYDCTIETGNTGCTGVYCEGTGDVGSGSLASAGPVKYSLHQNYPNPFNPSTTITFALPEKVLAQLRIYDVDGRLIRILVSEVLDRGVKEYRWDGTDSKGNPVSSGVYFYRLRAGTNVFTKKMVFLK